MTTAEHRRGDPTSKQHSHGQRMNAPIVLMAVGIIGVLLVSIQIFFFVQQRTALRDAQNELKDRQIASLQKEIRDRDAAIQRQLDQRDRQNRKTTCAIISSIPPDHGVVDVFRQSLKCGAYKKPKTSGAAASSDAGTSESGESQTTSTSASGPSRSTQKLGHPSTTTTTKSKSGSSQTKPSPSPSPSPEPSPSDSGSICVLGICIL